jgi:RNA polymerase sigma-70 factor (ECF subfamily)
MMTPQQKILRQALLTTAHRDYSKGLNSHAFFKTQDHSIGEDMVQDTFLKTWSYLVKGGKIETMKAFLYHILNNLIIDEYRKRKYRTTSLDDLVEKGFEPSNGDHERLVNFLDGKNAFLLIAKLPVAYQKIMRMRFIQNLSLTEISLITGQTKNTISVRVCRGLQKLKLLYKPA